MTLSTAPDLAPTEAQMRVLRLIAEGYSQREIAAILHLSRATIKTHARDLIHRIHATNRAEAVAIAFRRGYLE